MSIRTPIAEYQESMVIDSTTMYNTVIFGGVGTSKVDTDKLANQLQDLGQQIYVKQVSETRYNIFSSIDLTRGF